jgi:hypothetical protein
MTRLVQSKSSDPSPMVVLFSSAEYPGVALENEPITSFGTALITPLR